MLNNAQTLAPLACAIIALTSAPSFAGQAESDAQLLWESFSGTEAFIPDAVRFGSHDNHVWSAAGFGSRRLMLFDAVETDTPKRAQAVLASTSVGVLEIATAQSGRALFAVAQSTFPSGTGRMTEFARYDALDTPAGTTMTPTWTSDFATPGTLIAKVATDAEGERLLGATWDGTNFVLGIFDGLTGQIITNSSGASSHLRDLQVSDSGDRIALLAGSELWIYDRNLAPVLQHQFSTTPTSFSLSRDGLRFAAGFAGRVEIFREQPLWMQQQVITMPSNWVAARMDLDHTGRTLAIGWWNAESGSDIRFELRQGSSFDIAAEHIELGNPSGLQNLPKAVIVTANGERAALGCWGDGGSNPEVLLFDRQSGETLLELDLPGSVRSLDLNRDGTRIAVAFKESHANVIGIRGGVRVYDTREHDLKLSSVPSISNGLRLEYALPTVPHYAYVALGSRAPNPIPFGRGSLLKLDRASLRVLRAPSTGTPGETHFPLNSAANLRGREMSVQMIFRTATGMRTSTNVVDFTLL